MTFATTSTVVTISTSGQTVTADFGGNYIRTSSIRGTVTSGTTGIVATVTLAGPTPQAGTSNPAGSFEFTGLRAGDYTVTVSDFGTATITVTTRSVTVAVGQSANVSFVGTVEEVTTAATVTISTITVSGTAGVTVIPTAVVGAIDVNLTINEGTSTLLSASVLLDGAVVGTQTFATGAAAEDGPEGAERNATIQIGTAFCGASPGTPCASGNGTPTFATGNHSISAMVTTADAATATAANSVSLTFANPDIIIGVLTSSSTPMSAVSAASQLWYGGSLTATWTPVLYSGLTLGTLTSTYTDNDGVGVLATGPVTATAAPWATTFSAAVGGQLVGHSSSGLLPDFVSVTAAAYTTGAAFALGTAAAPAAFIGAAPAIALAPFLVLTDNVAPLLAAGAAFNLTDQVIPVAPAAAATVLCCANNWITSAYLFSSGLGATADLDGTLVNAGVGGIATTFYIGATGLGAVAIQALPSATTAGGAGIATSLLNTDNLLFVGLTDALGNRSNTPLAGVGSNLLASVGVEDNLPTAVAAAASPATITNQTILNAASAGGHLSGFSLGGVEDRAGFSAAPVQAWMTQDPATTNGVGMPFLLGQSAATGGTVNIPATIAACTIAPVATVLAFNATPAGAGNMCVPDGYYKMGGALMDQAGNIVAEIVRDWLMDATPPTTSNVAIPPTLTGGASATFSAAVTDVVDLWNTSFAFDFGPAGVGFGSFIPFTDPVQLGDGVRFDGARSTSASAVQAVPFVAQVELAAVGGGPPGAGSSILAQNVTATTFDAAGNSSTGANNFIAGTVTAVPEYVTLPGPLGTFQVLSAPWTPGTLPWPPAPVAVTLCDGQGAAACLVGEVTSVTLNAEATGPTGTMPNTFAGGTVYWFLVADDGDGFPYTTGPETWSILGTTSGSAATFTDDGVVAPTLRHYNHTFSLSGTHPAIQALGAGLAPGIAVNIAAIGVNTAGAALITQFRTNISVVSGT